MKNPALNDLYHVLSNYKRVEKNYIRFALTVQTLSRKRLQKNNDKTTAMIFHYTVKPFYLFGLVLQSYHTNEDLTPNNPETGDFVFHK